MTKRKKIGSAKTRRSSRKKSYVHERSSAPLIRHAWRVILLSKTSMLIVAAFFVIPLAAFEAHVINVTATIENRPLCDALSIGFWQNHEGCNNTPAESDWADEINTLSATDLQGAFATISGGQICILLAPSNCPQGGTVEGQRCRASGKTLADLSNIVSNHLELDALLAGADDGNEAFDNLGLSSLSTVREALYILEGIILSSDSRDALRDANHVAERIYSFYEDENPQAPLCIFEPGDIPPAIESTIIESYATDAPLPTPQESTYDEPDVESYIHTEEGPGTATDTASTGETSTCADGTQATSSDECLVPDAQTENPVPANDYENAPVETPQPPSDATSSPDGSADNTIEPQAPAEDQAPPAQQDKPLADTPADSSESQALNTEPAVQ